MRDKDVGKRVRTNLVSKGSTFSILRVGVGAGVGGATTLGPDLGGGHSASIEPAGSKYYMSSTFEISFGARSAQCVLDTDQTPKAICK